MEVYHGSYLEIRQPEMKYSRPNLDFGKGFYTTPVRKQAESWAKRFKKRKGSSIINIYEYMQEKAERDLKIKVFDTYCNEWIDFVLQCRRGADTSSYDIVVGGVANDKVFDTVELYFNNLIDRTEALKRLKYEKPNLQICFRKKEWIDKYLVFKGSEVVI